MAGPADRPASGAHLFPGPGRHRAPAPLPVGTATERIGRPHPLPGPGPGRDQAAQQSVALSQVVPHALGEVSLATGEPGSYPAGGAERVGPGHLGRERAGEAGKYRPGGIVPGPLQQGGTPKAHQARLLQSAGRTAGIRSRPAMAHRHGGRDAGASRPGGHALVDQPGQLASHRREQTTSLLSQCAAGWQRRVVFNVNYFCRLASIILAGSPPYPDPAVGPLRSGSWGHRIPGSPSGGPPGRWPLPWPWGWRRCAPTGRRPGWR